MNIRPDYQKVLKKVEEFFRRTGIARTPPIDLESAATAIGVTLVRERLEGDVSGFLLITRTAPPIIGINVRHKLPRQRFSLAHELGHLLLHAPTSGDASFVDKSFLIMKRDSRSGLGVLVHEVEANFFAAEVLMPAESLYRDIATTDQMDKKTLQRHLADRYAVSEEAVRFRLSNLGFIQL